MEETVGQAQAGVDTVSYSELGTQGFHSDISVGITSSASCSLPADGAVRVLGVNSAVIGAHAWGARCLELTPRAVCRLELTPACSCELQLPFGCDFH